MTTGEQIALTGLIVIVLTNIIGFVVIFTTLRNKQTEQANQFNVFLLDFRREVTRMDQLHAQHFAHAANTGIHQESMSKDTLNLHFDNIEHTSTDLSQRLKAHADEDTKLFREILDRLPTKRLPLPD